MLRRLWPGWKQVLILVQPETVVRWHPAGFKHYWTWLSRHQKRVGRKCVHRELRELIFRMVAKTPLSLADWPVFCRMEFWRGTGLYLRFTLAGRWV
jgi:hypothetical protein